MTNVSADRKIRQTRSAVTNGRRSYILGNGTGRGLAELGTLRNFTSMIWVVLMACLKHSSHYVVVQPPLKSNYIY
jgi:hypothetical protein